MPSTRTHRSRHALVAGALTAAVVVGLAASPRPAQSGAGDPGDRVRASWSSGSSVAAAGTEVTGTVTVPAGQRRDTRVGVRLTNARLTSIPDACRSTLTVLRRASYLSADRRELVCRVRATGSERTVAFAALVVGTAGEQLTATVTVAGASRALRSRTITPRRPGDRAPARAMRALSSPDFLNNDVGDLSRGPGFWLPGRTENSINAYYRRALDTILDDWRNQGPDDVLVAGDLVAGWWGTRYDGSGNFGPGSTLAQRKAALRRAAATYYPQWKKRFAVRGLDVHPAMGDHELGDNPWPPDKRRLVPTFEQEFARRFGQTPDGRPRYRHRPRGSRHELTAYAWRPHPSVQMITLNVFQVTPQGARIRLDIIQAQWVERVLRKARRDGVKWIIVQGHTPIVGPVRSHTSSNLMFEGGAHSTLWGLFATYGVDLYLCGEVHDVTATHRDGVLQVAHGGRITLGRTNYLVIDIYDDEMTLDVRDYDMRWDNAPDGSRLWQTRAIGMPKILEVAPTPFTIGTATIDGNGQLLERSGILEPYTP